MYADERPERLLHVNRAIVGGSSPAAVADDLAPSARQERASSFSGSADEEKLPCSTAAAARRPSSTSPASRGASPARSSAAGSIGLAASTGAGAPFVPSRSSLRSASSASPLGDGSVPASSTVPESATSTSASRSRAAGATIATRVIRAGSASAWSDRGMDRLLDPV
jgi:hypothetical protein